MIKPTLEKEFNRIVGEIARKSREELNLNQEDIANVIGVTRETIANIESGKNGTSIYKYFMLQHILGFENPQIGLDVKKIRQAALQHKNKRLLDDKQKKEKGIDEQIARLLEKKKRLNK